MNSDPLIVWIKDKTVSTNWFWWRNKRIFPCMHSYQEMSRQCWQHYSGLLLRPCRGGWTQKLDRVGGWIWCRGCDIQCGLSRSTKLTAVINRYINILNHKRGMIPQFHVLCVISPTFLRHSSTWSYFSTYRLDSLSPIFSIANDLFFIGICAIRIFWLQQAIEIVTHLTGVRSGLKIFFESSSIGSYNVIVLKYWLLSMYKQRGHQS